MFVAPGQERIVFLIALQLVGGIVDPDEQEWNFHLFCKTKKGDLTFTKNLENKESTRKHHHGMMLCKLEVEKRDGSHRCLQEGWMDNWSVLATLFVDIHFWDLLDNSHRVWRNLTSDLNIGRGGSYICLYKFGHRFGGFHESFLFPFAFKHPRSNALKSVNFHGATARVFAPRF